MIRRAKFDNHACRVCGSPDNGELHHLVPRSQRGDDIPDNLVRLCLLCHALIEARDDTTAMKLGLLLTEAERNYVIKRKGAYYLANRYRFAVVDAYQQEEAA